MNYLITEIIVYIAIAFLLGCVVGWLLKRIGAVREQAAQREEIARLQELLHANENQAAAGVEGLKADVVENAEQRLAPVAQASESVAVAAVVGDPADLESSYEIEEIEGVGSGFGQRLRDIQVESTLDLLNRCQDPAQVAEIAEAVGIEQFVVQKWISMADLLRVPGVRGQSAELLAYSGIDSVAALTSKKPTTLTKALAATHEKDARSASAPTEATVSGWIDAANRL
ncbi:MAG: DUF4332 domain-containing protein [Pseudomonadales bacterium]